MTPDAALLDFVSGFGLGALGLVPFLHTNTLLSGVPDASALLVVVLAFSHLAFETLPSVFFGVPTEGQGVGALPAHDLVRRGRGRAALQSALEGLVLGVLGALLLAAAFWVLGPSVASLLRPVRAWLLVALAVVVWVSDGHRLETAVAFGVFGALGFAVFSLPLNEPLFPLLAGLFGIPALLFSDGVQAQPDGPPVRLSWRWPYLGSFLGLFSVMLPALSPSWVASIALLVLPAEGVAVVALVSAISSSRMVFDFLAVPVLGVARSAPSVRWKDAGVVAADGVLLLAAGLVAFFLAVALSGRLAERWCRWMRRVPSVWLSFGLLTLAAGGAWALDGSWGLFVLAWSAAASALSLRLGIARKYALGVLVVPAAAYAWMAT